MKYNNSATSLLRPDTVALVTGASSGIGEATSRRLARDGARVVVVGRRKDRLQSLVQHIESDGGEALQ